MKNFQLPVIYPITDSRLTNLTHAEQVEKLTAAGARFIQLREKNESPGQFFADAEKALRIARQYSAQIIINDRVDLALALRADGVHLGQDDLPPAEARRILGKDAIIGFSAHTAEQALAALSLPVDYIAIGPVFSTKTKEDPEEIVGLIGIENVRRAIGEFPLAAIGGIDAKTVNAVLDSGANSAAVISAILVPSSKIAENFHSLVELF